jgi:NHS family xanthosine MFS transporter
MMNIKIRLTVMNFFQFFVWGAWLITIGVYCDKTMGWKPEDFGIIFSTMGIASIFMPTLCGIVADRWMNAERLYGILHILYGLTFIYLPMVNDPSTFFWIILLGMIFYMPTIALANSIAYSVLNKNNLDTVKHFPPIRVWGTVGFIAAMWLINQTESKASENQFYIAGITAVILGLYAFSLPKCLPRKSAGKNKSLKEMLGLDAFKLFKDYRMAVFFLFSLLLGAALQLTNAYGDQFLSGFENIPEYANTFAVRNSTVIISISQVSETLFILAIPFFLRKFGIKRVMLISMFAWVLRFGLFAYGDPAGGLWMIILSCIVYGMAFDFFNISGSLFVDRSTDPQIRSSAQGLFMMMTNGFGAVLGSWTSGMLIGKFFTDADGAKDWHSIWLCFAAYALVIAVLFAALFRYKHTPEADTKK